MLRNKTSHSLGRIALLGAACVGLVAGYGALAAGPAAADDEGLAAALAPEPGMRLISESQYVNTIAAVFGPDISLRVRFAPVPRVDGLLAVGASSAVMTSGALDPLEGTARAIAAQVVDPARRDYLVPCRPADAKAADLACAQAFFAKVGPLLYRRPMSDGELTRLGVGASSAVGPGADFYDGLAYVLSGMLVSPNFLYIRDTIEPDPARSGEWRLDGYSKAARLSFLLWNASPDEELLAAAERGDLHKPRALQRQLDRMIASPRYEQGVRAFFSDFLVLEAFGTLAKDQTIYPAFSLKAAEEAREQVLRTVTDHLITREGDYRDLFTTRRTMLSSELATLYRIPVNLGSQGWTPHEFGAEAPYGGLLTQIGFLAQYSHPGRSSPTRRGRAVREVLLCQPVPDPPPNVDFSNFEGPEAGVKSARDRLDMHNENPVCAGCHSLTDPIGLALENFDGAGQFRTMDYGLPIDASGDLDGVEFHDAVGLGHALRNSPALTSCMMNRLYAFSTGHRVTPEERPRLLGFQAQLDERGYRFDAMLKLIVLDPSFFAIRAPANPDKPLQTALRRDSHAYQN